MQSPATVNYTPKFRTGTVKLSYRVLDCAFNRSNCPELIGRLFAEAPNRVVVEEEIG